MGGANTRWLTFNVFISLVFIFTVAFKTELHISHCTSTCVTRVKHVVLLTLCICVSLEFFVFSSLILKCFAAVATRQLRWAPSASFPTSCSCSRCPLSLLTHYCCTYTERHARSKRVQHTQEQRYSTLTARHSPCQRSDLCRCRNSVPLNTHTHTHRLLCLKERKY